MQGVVAVSGGGVSRVEDAAYALGAASMMPQENTATVAFSLPRGRSRSKNVSSSVDTVTGEKKKRGRRSQSDSTKR